MSGYSRRRTVWLFLVPALVFYLVFVVAPIGQSFFVSLFDWDTHVPTPERFVWFDNYSKLAADSVFWKALGHNFILLVLSLVIQLPIALVLAALLSGRVFARSFFRAVYFAPMILPTVVIAIAWRSMYLSSDNQGLLCQLLDFCGITSPAAGFLGDSRFALLAIIVTISWRYVGFHMVIFMAGIEGIPEHLFEAARIDGANSWQLFRHVTLPSLGPVIRISAVLSIVGSLKYFDLVYLMTDGGPPDNVTELITTHMYRIGFAYSNAGYGSAIAVAGFLLSMIVVVAVMCIKRSKEPTIVGVPS